MFRTLLIANRGEIACRIIRTARQMGIRTVAVFSEADRAALHVALADEAHPIGPAPARESYLSIVAILAAARAAGAEAIHPGYGFLAENPAFAEACAAAGIVFVGPSAAAIRAMGLKDEAKALMARAGVPLVPGWRGEVADDATLSRAAEQLGWPVLIKAVAGGGGKGMKIALDAASFPAALASARREAQAAFGDERVLLERYLEGARHVEVQILADRYGHCLALLDRDCSVQRRHQKVIEEAPAPGLPDELRRAMGEAAVRAARAIGYEGAGTIEFLLARDGSFAFLEMNTRLQVEHSVTELVTGLDLVEWQLRIAAGEALTLRQEEIGARGHAIEARLCAEDPARDFVPQTGRIAHLRWPELTGLRVDTGVRAGDVISVHYDSLLAKLIVHGADRSAALRRLGAALAATEIAGIVTNLEFLRAIAAHPAFAAAELDTGFVDRHRARLLAAPTPADGERVALATLGLLLARAPVDPRDPWSTAHAWRLNLEATETFTLHEGATRHDVAITHRRDHWQIALGDRRTHRVAGTLGADGRLSAEIDGVHRRCGWVRLGDTIHLVTDDGTTRLTVEDPLHATDEEGIGDERITAPMPGRVSAVLVEAGAAVERGAALVVLEAMKIEQTIRAPRAGRIEMLAVGVGEQVEEGALLARLADDATA
jgi:3-methylcrotonyl-CoA carboxylase alpha subunit